MATVPWKMPQKTMVALEGASPRLAANVETTTSSDTSTLVVSTLAAKRGLAPSSAAIVFWGVLQGTVAIATLLVGGAETLQALAVLTGGPFAVLSLVAMAGLALTLYRRERGHTSVFGHVRDRLPEVQAHHDIEPPDDD